MTADNDRPYMKRMSGFIPIPEERRDWPAYPAYPQLLTFKQLQDEVRPWTMHNFGERPSWQPLLGIQEEVGELSHAHLKAEQGIRTNEDHEADGKDAVGDILVFLADYCNCKGWDMQEIIEETWDAVKQRDWKKDPEKGNV